MERARFGWPSLAEAKQKPLKKAAFCFPHFISAKFCVVSSKKKNGTHGLARFVAQLIPYTSRR
jgi:hypothetical protein